MNNSNLLLTTLGKTWQTVPEFTALFNTSKSDFYKNHPVLEKIENKRKELSANSIKHIWIITTETIIQEYSNNKRIVEILTDFHQMKPKVFVATGSENMSSMENCLCFREAAWRVYLKASEEFQNIIVSLAGGTKTMSADIQEAAHHFGCVQLVHLLVNKDKDSYLNPEFNKPLTSEEAKKLFPVFLAGNEAQQILKVPLKNREYPEISSNYFPVEEVTQEYVDSQQKTLVLKQKSKTSYDQSLLQKNKMGIVEAIANRTNHSHNIMTNYFGQLLKRDARQNFLSFYSLPSTTIEKLKKLKIGRDKNKRELELEFLQKIPKTELHCHLGGVLNNEELLQVTLANRNEVKEQREINREFNDWLNKLKNIVDSNNYDNNQKIDQLSAMIKNLRNIRTITKNFGIPEPLGVAGFVNVFKDKTELLDKLVFGDYLDEKQFCQIGIDKYRELGDLQGSGILQNEISLRKTLKILKNNNYKHNLKYMEIRCSPVKYTKGNLQSSQVVDIILDELNKDENCKYELIIIGTRDKQQEINEHIKLAINLNKTKKSEFDHLPVIKGFDLAGSEHTASASSMREAYRKLMEEGFNITIHAGETREVDSIWQAVYDLNADRIGHGLKLENHQDLISKLRNRKIAVELCPSSNFQISGFRDNYFENSYNYPEYPLLNYLRAGLRISINTDNPGISRTNCSNELLKAARLCPDGLSLWQLFLIIRSGFRSAFASKKTRKNLLVQAEVEISKLLSTKTFRNLT